MELGLLALQLLLEQRPHLRVVLYGTHRAIRAPFAFEQLGVEAPDRLRRLYNEATVGLSLSLTNSSLIPGEMLACGLPVVELSGRACESIFGADGSVITLARDDPADIARKLSDLLDDPERRERLSAAGEDFVRDRTWERHYGRDRSHSASGSGRACDATSRAPACIERFSDGTGLETRRWGLRRRGGPNRRRPLLA